MTIPFSATPIYTLNATANNNFSVSFSQQPTSYSIYLSTSNVYATVIAPPDSTQVGVLALLTSLNSKWLKSQNLGLLKVQEFSYESVQGFNYNHYFQHQADSTQIYAHQFASDLQYSKSGL
jgi:hypothetical protein